MLDTPKHLGKMDFIYLPVCGLKEMCLVTILPEWGNFPVCYWQGVENFPDFLVLKLYTQLPGGRKEKKNTECIC